MRVRLKVNGRERAHEVEPRLLLEWLERAYQNRNGWMAFLQVEPRLDLLRSDPRSPSRLRRMNFPNDRVSGGVCQNPGVLASPETEVLHSSDSMTWEP